MNALGFYIGGHDSNLSMVTSTGIVRYVKLERVVQAKHKKGNVEWVKFQCEQAGFRPDVIAYSDGNRNGLGMCMRGELSSEVAPLSGLFDVPTFCIDHHYAHILSAWPLLSKMNAGSIRGVCIDGRGDHDMKCSVIESPFDIHRARVLYSDVTSSYCLFLNRVGLLMGLSGGELDFAGKIMGICAYGRVSEGYVRFVLDYLVGHSLNELLLCSFRGREIAELCRLKDNCFLDWIASVNEAIFRRIRILIEGYQDGSHVMIYAGGCALNTVYNERLRERVHLVIPPHCYDGGISLGCVQYLALREKKVLDLPGFPFAQSGDDVGYASAQTIQKVVDLLSDGMIVGWCQGRGELGPRALGHRSILMNPSLRDGKDVINHRIKKREYWRPFAASIMAEDSKMILGEWRSCPYMLHAVRVDAQWRKKLPSVIHEDMTCRFQTVENEAETKTFHSLIRSFKNKTGVPALLNTSYNRAGSPIADSRDDILSAFESLDLDAVCIGDELIMKETI